MDDRTVGIVSLFIAAAFPAIMGAVLTPVSGGTVNLDVLSVLGLSFVFYVFSLFFASIFGLPLFFLFRHFDLIRWWTALLSGSLLGAIIAIILRLPDFVYTKDLLIFVPEGAASGLIFYFIWWFGTRKNQLEGKKPNKFKNENVSEADTDVAPTRRPF